MNDNEKMTLDKVDEGELVRENENSADNVKSKEKKKKKKSIFDDKKKMGVYIGSAALVFTALYMITDDGQGVKTTQKAEISKQNIKDKDIYSSSSTQEAAKMIAKRDKMIAATKDRHENNVTKKTSIAQHKLNREEILKNLKKKREEKLEKEKEKEKEKDMFLQKKEIRKNKETRVEREKKREIKREKFDKNEKYTIVNSTQDIFRCFSVSDSDPLYKIINSKILKYKSKKTSIKKLDGQLINAKKGTRNVLFLRLKNNDAVQVIEDRVFCDMDTRG